MSQTRVKPGELGGEIGRILQEYVDEIVREMPDAAEQAAKAGVKALKSAAASSVGGSKYKKSFAQKQTESNSRTTTRVIYSNRYQVAHLLEHGHVVKNKRGIVGVAPAHPHWAAAEEAAAEELEKRITQKVQEAE